MKKNLKQYLLTLHYANYQKNIAEDRSYNTTLMILNFLALNPSSSICVCYKYLNNNNMTIAYKNVHRKVHNLIEIGLIQKVKKSSKRGNEKSCECEEAFIIDKSKYTTIYYSISSAGLFHLFKTNRANIDKDLILKNKNDEIFKTFLFPYLDITSLEKIDNKVILNNIFRYLSKCCNTVHTELIRFNIIEKQKAELDLLAVTSELTEPECDNDEYGSKQFIEYLKNKFNIKWLDVNTTKIIEVESEKLLKICDEKKNELLFELYPERNKAILSERNRKIEEFVIEEWYSGSGTYDVMQYNPFMVEEYIDRHIVNEISYVLDNIQTFVHELCHSIIESVFSKYPYPSTEEEKISRRQTCIALAKDKKFQAIVHDIERKLDSSSYENFIRCSKE